MQTGFVGASLHEFQNPIICKKKLKMSSAEFFCPAPSALKPACITCYINQSYVIHQPYLS